MRHLRSLLLLALLGAAVASHAAVLDFESLSGTPGLFVTSFASPVTTGGYRFATPQGFVAWTPTSYAQTGYALYTGSTALSADGFSSTITMDRADGSTFDLTSIDIASAWTADYTADYIASQGNVSETIAFEGTRTDGSTVTQLYSPVLNGSLNTLTFQGFDNLRSLTWTQDQPFHQFDNVNVRAAVQATPEPASFAALAVGAVALLRRRKRG